jgi:hypothetical protein
VKVSAEKFICPREANPVPILKTYKSIKLVPLFFRKKEKLYSPLNEKEPL